MGKHHKRKNQRTDFHTEKAKLKPSFSDQARRKNSRSALPLLMHLCFQECHLCRLILKLDIFHLVTVVMQHNPKRNFRNTHNIYVLTFPRLNSRSPVTVFLDLPSVPVSLLFRRNKHKTQLQNSAGYTEVVVQLVGLLSAVKCDLITFQIQK